VVGGPDELHPYQSYKRWPVPVSALVSAAVAGAGVAAVASGLYVLTQHVLVGIVLLACVSVVVPTLLLSGLGGLVMAVRFMRLSPDWRSPRHAGAPVAPGPAKR
jgi:phosphate/sulfate permease